MNAAPWVVPFCAGSVLTVVVEMVASLAIIVLMARDAPPAPPSEE